LGFIKRKHPKLITHISNIIQFDSLGYPSRLCIVQQNNKNEQMWIDTDQKDEDVVLKWTELEQPCRIKFL